MSRRDDLESLGYIFIYLYFGNLKWAAANNNNDNNNSHINSIVLKAKENIIKLYNLPNIFDTYMNYVKHLEYDDYPDYNYLINLFQEEINIQEENI